MSQEINVLAKTQVILVDPVSGSVAVVNAGPMGPAGPMSTLPGPPGPAGPPGVNASLLLDIPLPIVLFTALAPSSDFSWTEIGIDCYAALFIRLTIFSSATSSFAYKATSKPIGAGEEMLAAGGFPSNESKLSWPWWYNNDRDPRETKMYFGIRNQGVVNSTFTITDLRGYSLEA